jgi:peptidoglycan/LPS O-acetylase OafA/YrhL
MRRDIQGLRGLAVLMVVLYHAGVPFVPGGFVGVDVFFVISGFLITRLLVDELEAHGRIDIAAFLARRARRLLPAALALIALVAVAASWFYPPMERDGILAAARAAGLYVANLWFARRSVDYLGGQEAENPMLHMWSLGVEEQFYLVWPLAIALAAALVPAARVRMRVLRMVAVLSLASLAASLWMTARAQPWAFFGTPFRAWEFGLGALVHLFGERLRALPARRTQGLAAIGLTAVLLGAALLDDHLAFPGTWALAPAAGTALLLAGLQREDDGPVRRALGQRMLARVGDVSYSWYLWHWPLLVAVASWGPDVNAWHKAGVVLASLVLAELSYRGVEQPFRRGTAGRVPARHVLAAALLATVVAALLLTLARRSAANEPTSEAQKRYAAARADIPSIYARGCHADFAVTDVRECTSGEPDARSTVVLFGDSHAAHWYPALERLAASSGWRLVSITKSGCPAVDVTVVNAVLRREFRECDEWRAKALRGIAAMGPALVVMGNSSRYGVPPALWEAGARRTLTALEEGGVRAAVLMRDTPVPGFSVPLCLARADYRHRPAEGLCAFDREAALSAGRAIDGAERRAANASPRGSVVDMSTSICPLTRCPVVVAGRVRFSDGNHLTATYSAELADELRIALDPALPR